MLSARQVDARGVETAARVFDATIGCWTTRVQPGEYYITIAHENEAISTVLGSCVTACMRDPEALIGGINHFMLPAEPTHGRGDWRAEVGLASRYGSYAMENLVNGLLKLGARRDRLQVKLFGGAQVLDMDLPVGLRNVEFANRWLGTEGVPVLAQDVGGRMPRRILYFPATGIVKVKHLRPVESREVFSNEKRYIGDVATRPLVGEIELFSEQVARR